MFYRFFAREMIVPSPLAVEPKRMVLKAIENHSEISNSNSNKCTGNILSTKYHLGMNWT